MRRAENAPKRIKKQKSIASKLQKSILTILALSVLIIFAAYLYMPEWTFYVAPATRLILAAEDIAQSYNTAKFADTLKKTEKKYNTTIEIYDKNDRFVYSTGYYQTAAPSELPEKLSEAPTVDSKFKLEYVITSGSIQPYREGENNRGFILEEYNGNGFDVSFLVCYAYLPGGELMHMFTQVSQAALTGKIEFLVIFGTLIFALFFAYLIIRIYIKNFAKPITNMCDITDRMSQLDFSRKCPPTTLSEITRLSDSINTLSDTLDKALRDLRNKNEKLRQDIEDEKTIDNLRQTFISGISHELKTPISIIQGYAEGAKMFYEMGAKEKADSYCDTVAQEAARMNTMILKLLEITKFSSGAYEPVRENFNIYDMVEDWYNRNSSIFAERGIKALNNVDKTLTGNGDRIILASVLNNYLSNALSHVEGDMIIRCWAKETDGKYRLYVTNTGRQIAAKDIDKIWTSFYRADKSLSRSQGRFGLGLAIAASIQDLHGEKYGVKNEENGVSFWFDIKKA